MRETIAVAESDADYAEFGELVGEYWGWLRLRYCDLPGFIDAVAGHQQLDEELASLRLKYGPPSGRVLLARRDDDVAGGIAYRRLGDGACEMKRLFVRDRFQGQGLGRRLCNALLDAAIADGYEVMRLDTGSHNDEAMAMYESMGFRQCPPFHDYPADLLPNLAFLEIRLVG